MSGFIKKPKFQSGPVEAEHKSTCAAHGCPLPGSINLGSAWLCAAHQWAEAAQWPKITESIINDEDIRAAIETLATLSEFEWSYGKWELMDKFFEHKPELRPSEPERVRKVWYDYRMRAMLEFNAGARKKYPQPRTLK